MTSLIQQLVFPKSRMSLSLISITSIIESVEWHTAQKMKFSIKDFFSKCDQIRRKLQVRSHLLKKSLTKNFIFCAVILLGKNAPQRIWK